MRAETTRPVIPFNFPQVVTLCGSTKFKEEFIRENFRLTMEGFIVISVGWFSHADGKFYAPSPEEKKKLDELHLRKIDLSDMIFVINVKKPWCLSCERWCDNQFQTGRYAYDDGRTECCGAHWIMKPYVGESTAREIAYAKSKHIPVRYLEPM